MLYITVTKRTFTVRISLLETTDGAPQVIDNCNS